MTDIENVHHLTYEDKHIILVGTAHVSKESAELVARVIEEEKPDTVCIELCQSRYQSLTQPNRWQNMDIFKVIREQKSFLLLSNLILSHFQKKIGQKLGVKPGGEMLRANEAAQAVGASVRLVDRDVRVTLSRTWRLMGFRSKMKLMIQLVTSVGELEDIREEDIENLKRKDILEALLEEVGASLPELRRVLIDERDQYLAHEIRTSPGSRIVAVVGAGHVPGIEKYWNQPIDLEPLNRIPPKSKWTEVVKWGLPALLVGLMIAGFFVSGKSTGAHMVMWWVMATAGLAAVGAAGALAHPLTVISAGLAAPFAAIHPLIAAGWVSGLVEAYLRKPKVKDFESLSEDMSSLKGFWRNKVTRILLVVALTNLGSMLGTFVALPLMVRNFT